MSPTINLPPKEIITPIIGNPNFELIVLWMLSNNEMCKWSDFKGLVTPSTLSLYLRKLIADKCVIKKKHNHYIITSKGVDRFHRLSQEEDNEKKIVYPPEVILKRRNYKNWIIWLLYNNNSCSWRDFQREPLSINQSSLSKTLKLLLRSGLISKEDKEYKLTFMGKNEYVRMLRSYNLDRQSILDEESKRIEEMTKKVIEFFENYDVTKESIHYRFLQYALRLNHDKVKQLLTEEDFQKVILYLAVNHPDQYPESISVEEFSRTYGIKKLTLEYYIAQIVENQLYSTKFFKLEKDENQLYYFQFDDNLEKTLRVITEQIITRTIYLNKLYTNSHYNAPNLSLNTIIDKILENVNGDILNPELKLALREFLPEYINYLAFKIEKETKLVNEFDKLEGIIWQNLSEAIDSNIQENKKKQIYGESEFDYYLNPTILNIVINFEELEEMDKYNLIFKKINDKDYGSALEQLELLSQEEKDNEVLMLIKPLLLCYLNRYPEALTCLNIKFPTSKSLDKDEIFLVNALLYSFSNLSLGNFKDALKMSEKVISTFPDYSISCILKGMTLGYNILYNSINDQKAKKETITLLERAIELEKNELNKPWIYHLKAFFLIGFNDYSTALIDIETALSIRPQSFELYFLKIEILKYLNQYSKILSLLDELSGKFPEKEKTLKLIQANTFKIRNQIENALKIVEELLIRFPEDDDVQMNKVYYLQYLNRSREAIEMIQTLKDRKPDNGIFNDIYGELLMYMEDYEYAKEQFLKAIEIDPQRWYIHQSFIKLGICYKEIGKYDLALENLLKGKKLTQKQFCNFQTKEKWLTIADLFINEINLILES